MWPATIKSDRLLRLGTQLCSMMCGIGAHKYVMHCVTHRSKEEGNNNEPDDIILKCDECLLEAECLCEDCHGHRQEGPCPCWQGLQNKPCSTWQRSFAGWKSGHNTPATGAAMHVAVHPGCRSQRAAARTHNSTSFMTPSCQTSQVFVRALLSSLVQMQDGKIRCDSGALVPAIVETKIDSSVQAWVLRPEGMGTRKRSARPMAALPSRGTTLTPGQGFDGVLAASAGSPAATAADACTCTSFFTVSQAV